MSGRRNGYNQSITRRPSFSEARLLKSVHVPFVDLGPTNRAVKERVLTRIAQMIDRGDFTNGEAVVDFERSFAESVGRQHCVGLASGLDALRLSLVGSNLVAGDGVIVPASTFAA